MKTTHRTGRRARRGDQPRSDEEVRGGWTPLSALPDRVRETTWRLTPRHVTVLAILITAGLVWAGWSLTRASPQTIPSSTTTPGTPISQPSPGPPGSGPGVTAHPGTHPSAQSSPSMAAQPGSAGVPGQPMVIHVAGKVRRPGVIRAPAGSRVADAITAAGGALPGVDLSSVNLARPLTDGEQILVGIPTSPAMTTSPGQPRPSTAATPQPTLINLNTATLADLDSLPGVGPVLAQRILEYRSTHGRFATIDELQDVTGVGSKKFESLKSHVHV